MTVSIAAIPSPNTHGPSLGMNPASYSVLAPARGDRPVPERRNHANFAAIWQDKNAGATRRNIFSLFPCFPCPLSFSPLPGRRLSLARLHLGLGRLENL